MHSDDEVVGPGLGVLALGLAERGAYAVDEDDLSLLSGHLFSFRAPMEQAGGDSGVTGYP